MVTLFGGTIRFVHPEYLWWSIPVIVFLAVLMFLAHHNTREEYARNRFLRLHVDEVSERSTSALLLRFIMTALLITLLFFVTAEPEKKNERIEPVYGGVRVAFLLDVSLSMKYAHDTPPFPDRLTAAKNVLASFADMTVRDPELSGKYSLAIIPFAGEATVYLPFTRSYEEFVETVDAIDETVVGAPGTSLFLPILAYEDMLKENLNKDEHTVDIVVLISDGGRGEGIRSEMTDIRATALRLPSSVTLYTVGVGSVETTLLPDGTATRKTKPVELVIRDRSGAFIAYAMEDKNDPKSKVLRSELDEEVLVSIAGDPSRYFFFESKPKLLTELKRVIMEKRKLEKTITHESFVPVPEWFLVPAFAIAFLLFGYHRGFARVIPRWR